jgi:hypothetical protein
MNRGQTGFVDQIGDGGILTRNNQFRTNTYSAASITYPFLAPTDKTVAQWQALGYDTDGTFH